MNIERVNAIISAPVIERHSWIGVYFELYRYSTIDKIRKRWYRCSNQSSPMIDSNAELLWLREGLSQAPYWSINENNRNK